MATTSVFSSPTQPHPFKYWRLLRWITRLLALTLRIRGNAVTFMLVWIAPFVVLMFFRGGNIALYILFLTLPAGFLIATALEWMVTRLKVTRFITVSLIAGLSASMWFGSATAYQPQLQLPEYLRLYETSICYKPIGYLLRQHFPAKHVATQYGTPPLYWYGEWRNNVTPEVWTVVIVRDDRVFDEPFFQAPVLAAQRETEYNLQQAVSNIPELHHNFTLLDDFGQPLCHVWSDNPLPHTALSASQLSQAFDTAYGTIEELRR